MDDGVILARWRHRAESDGRATIVPDGCRDLIVRHAPGERPCWFLSPLDEQSRHVQVARGTFMQGFRLKPGVRIDQRALLLRLAETPRLEAENLADCIQDFSVLPASVEEALACLACEVRSVGDARALLGVSPRTLQRLLIHETGRPPSFWIRLSRARRAGRALLHGHPLSEIAFRYGFSDQAHMTREFRRWFDLTPSKARRDASFRDALHQSGHG